MSDKVKGILLREETLEAMIALSDEQRGRLILALFADSGMCSAPELDPMTRVAFLCIVPGVRRAQEDSYRRYTANVENGKKGGRPRKQPVQESNEETDGLSEKPMGFEDETQKPKPNQTKLNQTNININTLSECLSGQSPDEPSRQEDSESEGHAGKRPACPVKEIVAMYHDILPEHPRVEIINAQRRGAINARWADIGNRLKEKGSEDSREARLEYMKHVFLKASRSSFLTGHVAGRDGKPYMVTLDKLMSPSGFIGVIEGRYNDR